MNARAGEKRTCARGPEVMDEPLVIIENHNSSHHDGGVAIFDSGQIIAVTAERVDRIKHSGDSQRAYEAAISRLDFSGKRVHDFFDPTYRAEQPINHPLAHAASAFYPSGFEEAIILVVDGQGTYKTGQLVSTSVWHGYGNEIKDLEVVAQPGPFCDNSLGHFYSAATYYLGFGFYEQGKTMAA